MEKSQSKCAVIGYGSWATAIVKIFAENGVRVAWHILNPEVLASVREEGRNCKYLRDVDLDTSRMELSDDINTVVRDADTVVMAMPSAFTKAFLEPLTTPLADKTVISAVKGIVPGEYLSVAGYLIRRYGIPEHQMALVTGPSHAEEVGMGRLSYLTVVGTDPTLREQVAHMFERPYIRISHSEDIFGVEYAAIMKNIYALAVGMAVGLGYGDNFIAVLIANCAAEMERFLAAYAPQRRNICASAYLGDLLVTSYSTYSRNRRLGLLIGRGCTVRSAMNEMTMVAEGYYAAECIRHIASHSATELPIADTVYEILYRNASARRKMRELTHKLI